MLRRLLARLRRRPLETETGDAPLESFDLALEALEHRGAHLRRAAAAMLALRGGLERDRAAQASRLAALERRITEARALGERGLVQILVHEAAALEASSAQLTSQLLRTSEDASSLLAQAGALQQQLDGLRRERAEAAVILDAGRTLDGLQQPAALSEVSQCLALEAARDEVARVEALAAIRREEAEGQGP